LVKERKEKNELAITKQNIYLSSTGSDTSFFSVLAAPLPLAIFMAITDVKKKHYLIKKTFYSIQTIINLIGRLRIGVTTELLALFSPQRRNLFSQSIPTMVIRKLSG
jgi:uncharacterized Fe-S cluster-containing radical SAM superfamily enzyme